MDLRAAERALTPHSHRYERLVLGALVLAGAAVWTVALVLLLDSGLIDLQVYRTGGQAWLNGQPLYDPAFPAPLPGPPLPFTYPPLAAVLFAALAVLPWWAAVTVVVGSGLAGLVATGWLAAGRLTGDRMRMAILTAAVVAIAPALEPVRESVSFGQINLLLLGMIAADCLLPRTPWPRGMLIGLAAAVKLTPAAFVLFFVARRQWRPVLVAAATFAGAAVGGLLLAPSDTRGYWFDALLDPGRIGGLEFASNQAVRGVLHRFGLPAGVELLGWLALAATIGVLALVGIARLRNRGDDVGALLVTAAATLLVSPVSWSHHWVWVTLAVLWLGVFAWRRRSMAFAAVTALVVAVFVAAPHWWMPYRESRELDWAWWQHLVGNAYFWCALAAVLSAGLVGAQAGPGVGRVVGTATTRSVPSSRGQRG